MWHHLFHNEHISSGAAKAYTLAGFLVTAPGWMPTIAEVNQWIPLLTFFLGCVVAYFRIRADLRRSKDKD